MLRVALVFALALAGAACQAILGIHETQVAATSSDAAPPRVDAAPLPVDAAPPPVDASPVPFHLGAETGGFVVVRGGPPVTLHLTLVRDPGFTGEVTATLVGLPDGAFASNADFSNGGTTASLTVTAGPAAPVGEHVVTLHGLVVATSQAVDAATLTLTIADTPGTIDSSFNGGAIALQVDGPLDSALAVAIDDEQRIVVGLTIYAANGGAPSMMLARFLPTGAADPGFSTTTRVAGTLTGMALSGAGSIVVAGYDVLRGAVVVRFDTDGNLDPTFAEVFANGGAFIDSAASGVGGVMTQSSGAIVFTERLAASGGRMCRLSVNGGLDTTFGMEGCASPHLEPTGLPSLIRGSGDEIAGVGTWTDTGHAMNYFYCARFTAAGVESGATPAADPYTLSGCLALGGALSGSNLALLAGQCGGFAAVVRGDETGPDPSFNGGAILVDDAGSVMSSSYGAVAVQSDRRIVAAGQRTPLGGVADGFVTRLDDDGTVDMNFGTNGIAVIRPGGAFTQLNAVALAADGRIVVVGHTDGVGAAILRVWP